MCARSSRAAVVTGGAGFIGSHTVDALLADSWKVIVVDDLSTGDAGNVSPQADLEVVDISDRGALDRVIDSARPSAVFHLAAQSSVTRSVSDPERDCQVNVQGTLNVVLAAARHDACVVFTSTGGALYGNHAVIPTPEDSMPAPISPYGASKWSGEAYVVTWREATAIPHSVCRLANVYGPRQSPYGEAGVVAIFTHRLWRAETPTLYGFGGATRDYIYVDDVTHGLISALGKGGTFNISTGIETDVRTVFDVLRHFAGTDVEPELVPLRTGELERSCMDPTRAAQELGWRARLQLADGLTETYTALVEGFETQISATDG